MTVQIGVEVLPEAVRALAMSHAAASRAASLRLQLDRENRLAEFAARRLSALSGATATTGDQDHTAALAAAEADVATHDRAASVLQARLARLDSLAQTDAPSNDPTNDRRVLLATQVTLVEAAQQAASDAARELSGVTATLVSTGTGTMCAAPGSQLLSAMVEHGLLDPAMHQLARAQAAMDVLAAELDDVTASGDQPESVDGDLDLFDRWFADFFTDFALDRRLVQAHHVVHACQEDLAVVAGRLDARHAHLALRLRAPSQPGR